MYILHLALKTYYFGCQTVLNLTLTFALTLDFQASLMTHMYTKIQVDRKVIRCKRQSANKQTDGQTLLTTLSSRLTWSVTSRVYSTCCIITTM